MSEGLAQGTYVAARMGFEPPTLQTQGTELATEPPCPTLGVYISLIRTWLYDCYLVT